MGSESKGAKIVGGNPEKGRREMDFYPTPDDVTTALLDFLGWRNATIWEPAAGDGAKDQGCETPTDCAWHYECVKIGGVYEPVGEIVDAAENIHGERAKIAELSGGGHVIIYEDGRIQTARTYEAAVGKLMREGYAF